MRDTIIWVFIYILFCVTRIGPRSSCTLGRCTTPDLWPNPTSAIFVDTGSEPMTFPGQPWTNIHSSWTGNVADQIEDPIQVSFSGPLSLLGSLPGALMPAAAGMPIPLGQWFTKAQTPSVQLAKSWSLPAMFSSSLTSGGTRGYHFFYELPPPC